MLFRQGDIYIEAVRCVPEGAVEKQDMVLAEGEATGHRHRVRDLRSAMVFVLGDQIFVDVTADRAEIVHDEHGTIELNRGVYRVWRQREYDPTPEGNYRYVFD
ncbi:MAG TPA: hypothetical protein VHU84_10095 [Lacipirellulaceae bacterium]|nr:hypothetical protein [Lacipirellulaceae bacterium]